MKKTLLALAVMAAAGSAQAGNLYDNDVTSVNISGEVDTVLKQLTTKSGGTKVTDNDAQVTAWANAQFDIDHKLSDSVTAFGSFEVEADNGENVKVDDARIGFKGDFGKFTFGETGAAYGILEKAELTNEGADTDVVYDTTESAGHGIRYDITVLDSLALAADYQTNKDENKDADWSISADYAVAGFTIGAAYFQGDESAGYDSTSVGVSASYEIEGFYVAATYTDYKGQGDVNVEGGESTASLGDHDGNSAALAMSYSWDAYKVYGAYQTIMADKTTSGASIDADLDNWYIGFEYAVMSNLTAFVEYNGAELSGSDVVKKQEADFAALGLYLTF
ncbi:porin [Vibrio aestuarianus]|uniref:porin n=1 Tax=Vibrio aestuarianus TaxID=28171 RepID=UPI001559AAA3|nr:porin [Vibrio aestuarianus]NGZ14452.1 porin [Vibrio aestuarianus]NKZ50600.1 porin [Vibrio aestuarianus]CAH8236373.1 Putative outer membrane porin protein [Vibrio aestuarianus]